MVVSLHLQEVLGVLNSPTQNDSHSKIGYRNLTTTSVLYSFYLSLFIIICNISATTSCLVFPPPCLGVRSFSTAYDNALIKNK